MDWDNLLSLARQRLKYAISETSRRSFDVTSQWLSEMLVGLVDSRSNSSDLRQRLVTEWFSLGIQCCPQLDDEKASAELHLALNAFRHGEYSRSRAILQRHWSQNPSVTTSREKFYCCYAEFRALEKRTEKLLLSDVEEQRKPESPVAKGHSSSLQVSNEEWTELLRSLESISPHDPYLLYIRALVMQYIGEGDNLIHPYLVHALQQEPYLWDAWKEIVDSGVSIDEFYAMDLPKGNFLYTCTEAAILEKHGLYDKAEDTYTRLMEVFPNALYLKRKFAALMKSRGNYRLALETYHSISQLDEFYMEHYLEYSNLLSVHGQRNEVSALAMQSYRVDPTSLLTQLLIANFFSATKQHEKAVEYLHRALRISPKYATTWVLLGHEYNELVNHEGAIFAFAHGAKVSPNDHRSWYGLGCTYDSLNLDEFAEYFLQQAVTCNPRDSRLSLKLVGLLERQNRHGDCVDVLQKSLSESPEPDHYVYLKLASIYEGPLKDTRKAIEQYEMCLDVLNDVKHSEIRRAISKKLGMHYYTEGMRTDYRIGEDRKRSLESSKHHIDAYLSYDSAADESAESDRKKMRLIYEKVEGMLTNQQ